ncbi:hypothetical protein ETD86_11620 [Nonomuraea turkmeniaca]|uniref:Uncharacterized protein n=1 Tax=Nonomuraea turkmeniaca TaxID=103838 RepID=A0A5S4FP79_9ACTN|nr:hypothetical protein [Nonomuraea turkmeniaca]TMR22486.1 hypothetical protein ETD86_11620 [Nonomuraea turkmeniaca]
MVREAAAGMDGVTVVDFADLGVLPPEARKAAHILAEVNAVADFLAQLTEACDIYLARRIAAQLAETSPDGDGGLDLSLGETATRIAADADPAAWDELQMHARRDILTTCAQRLATVQQRHLPDTPEARANLAKMIGNTFAIGGNLWVFADKELMEAGDGFEQVRMLPDSVDLPPRASSPTNQHAAKVVADFDGVSLLANAAILLMVAQVIELNATGGWDEFLQENLP